MTTTELAELRPGRSYCAAVESNSCQAPAGFANGMGHAALPGVRRADLLTCAYCGEPVCRACSDTMTPPEFFRDQTPVPVCLSHPEDHLADWLGV